MRETHFALPRRCPAAHQREVRGGVVRGTERPRREQRTFAIDETGDAVDRARDDRLVGIERREQRRDRASQECLARSRWPDQ